MLHFVQNILRPARWLAKSYFVWFDVLLQYLWGCNCKMNLYWSDEMSLICTMWTKNTTRQITTTPSNYWKSNVLQMLYRLNWGNIPGRNRTDLSVQKDQMHPWWNFKYALGMLFCDTIAEDSWAEMLYCDTMAEDRIG